MALDHFSVTRNTTKTVLNKNGVLETVPANVPAFEFNPDGTFKGCLIEPSATNLLLRSEEFDNAYWTKTALNTSGTPAWVNVAEAPDGTMTAERLIEDTSTSVLRGVSRTPPSLSGVHTLSFFAKSNGRFKMNVASDNQTFIPINVNFDLTDGFTASGVGDSSVVVKAVSNGWFRVSATTGNCTGSANLRIRLRDNDGNQSYTGDGESGIFLWGAQLETGSVATSYTKTVASTATRNADVIERENAEDLIGQDEGTVFCELLDRKTDSFRRILILGDDTNGIRLVQFSNNEYGAQLRVGGSSATTINAGLLDGSIKICCTYTNNQLKIYVNGALKDTSTISDIIPNLNEVSVGATSTGGASLNSHISSVALYKRALTQSEAEALTS